MRLRLAGTETRAQLVDALRHIVDKFRKRLEKWTERGHLIWVDHDEGKRLYRVGDVLDLQIEHARDPRGWIGRRAAV